MATAAVVSVAGVATLLVPMATLPSLDTRAWIGLEVELVAHVALSMGAVLLWGWARPRLPLAALALLAVGVALGTEVLQALPSVARSAEAADVVYNLVGIALGLALLVFVRGVWRGWRGETRLSARAAAAGPWGRP